MIYFCKKLSHLDTFDLKQPAMRSKA